MPKDSMKPSKKDKAPKVKATVAEAAQKPAAAASSSAVVGGADKKASKKDKKNKAEKPAVGASSSTGVVPATVVDQELDDLFKTSAVYGALPVPAPAPARARPTTLPSTSKTKRKRDQVGKLSEGIAAAKAAAAAEAGSDAGESDEEEDDEGIEEAYEAKKAKVTAAPVEKRMAIPGAGVEDGLDDDGSLGPAGSDDDEEAGEASGSALPVHESLLPGAKAVKPKKVKTKAYVPEGETREERDGRTIFVGNLGVEVAKSKPFLHLLHAHLLASIPTAKIESTRFRSVAFSKPTEELPAQDEKEEENRAKARQKERAKSWREEIMISKEGGAGKGGEAEADKGKSYLTPGEKRKVAFIKKDFHPGSDHVNAYIVFSYAAPDRAANVRPIMAPHEAATMCAQHCNGTTFQGRTIRVDQVRAAASTASTARATSTLWVAGTDPKRSVFVGNLEFAAKEEEVRVFFEGLVTKERGKATADIEGGEARWVTNVRIVRDRATGLGKGFAYVALKDRESVDEILVMSEEKLKYGKRTLRVQRCKSLPAKPKAAALTPGAAPLDLPPHLKVAPNSVLPTGSIPESFASVRPRLSAPRTVHKIVVPKGNPLLGESIKDLSKEDRKVAKSADAERMARRVAKKKARTALERSGGVSGGTGGMKERVKLDGGMGAAKAKKKPGVNLRAKKSRTRSSNAADKRNHKKE